MPPEQQHLFKPPPPVPKAPATRKEWARAPGGLQATIEILRRKEKRGRSAPPRTIASRAGGRRR